jgi:hypothetical protein
MVPRIQKERKKNPVLSFTFLTSTQFMVANTHIPARLAFPITVKVKIQGLIFLTQTKVL